MYISFEYFYPNQGMARKHPTPKIHKQNWKKHPKKNSEIQIGVCQRCPNYKTFYKYWTLAPGSCIRVDQTCSEHHRVMPTGAQWTHLLLAVTLCSSRILLDNISHSWSLITYLSVYHDWWMCKYQTWTFNRPNLGPTIGKNCYLPSKLNLPRCMCQQRSILRNWHKKDLPCLFRQE